LPRLGIGAGAPFVDTVTKTGFKFILLGAAIALAAVLVIMLIGQFLFKLSTDDLFGIVCATTGNPAITEYANQAVPSDRTGVGYATIYPSMTILKIICAQVAIIIFGTG
jgi:putative transport protein